VNYPAVSVLMILVAEPRLSNSEVAERVCISGRSHMSMLLARLREQRVVENTVDAPLPFEANAWQLTASGRELETAIPDYGRATATRTSPTTRPPAPTKETR
jgi:hypothetical protein